MLKISLLALALVATCQGGRLSERQQAPYPPSGFRPQGSEFDLPNELPVEQLDNKSQIETFDRLTVKSEKLVRPQSTFLKPITSPLFAKIQAVPVQPFAYQPQKLQQLNSQVELINPQSFGSQVPQEGQQSGVQVDQQPTGFGVPPQTGFAVQQPGVFGVQPETQQLVFGVQSQAVPSSGVQTAQQPAIFAAQGIPQQAVFGVQPQVVQQPAVFSTQTVQQPSVFGVPQVQTAQQPTVFGVQQQVAQQPTVLATQAVQQPTVYGFQQQVIPQALSPYNSQPAFFTAAQQPYNGQLLENWW